MKTTFQNQHRCGLQSDLEAVIEREHEKIKKEIVIKAIHYAKQNRPHLSGDSLPSYLGEFTSQYEKMISSVMHRLIPDFAIEQSKTVNEDAQDKIRKQEEKRDNARAELENLQLNIEQEGIPLEALNNFQPKKSNDWVPHIIVIGETVFNTGALQLLNDIWIYSLIISISISLAIFGLARQLAKFLKENTADSRKKRLITIGATAMALLVFYFLAVLRAKQMEENDSFRVHPIFLIGINILFFAITCWHFFRNAQSPEEKKNYERLKQLKEKKDSLEQEISKAESEIDSIKADTKQKLQELLKKPIECKWLIELVQRWKQEAIEIFKSTNLSYRRDRQTPDCFRESISGYFINS